MSTSTGEDSGRQTFWDSPGGRTLASLGRRLFGARRPSYPLIDAPLPIVDLPRPASVRFWLGRTNNVSLPPIAKKGTEVAVGDAICDDRQAPIQQSPLAGVVTGIANAPDVRGGKGGRAVLLAPAAEQPSPLPALDPGAAPQALLERIGAAGVMHGSVTPRRLDRTLAAGAETLVVLAADREPAVRAAGQLFRDRMEDAATAARLLGRAAGCGRVLLAVLPALAEEARGITARSGLELLVLDPVYPQTLDPMIARRVAGKTASRVVVVEVQAALAALDAVREGVRQTHTVVTVVSAGGTPLRNLRVPLGMRIGDVLAAADLEPKERDKVVAGGPMRGFAQATLEGAVDAGLDALLLIPADEVAAWSDAPCINCGVCVDVCPQDLQVHLIGRYAEFQGFERTAELSVAACMECGLCAAACTARRPLLQLIRLAKREGAAAIRAQSGTGEAQEETEEQKTAAA